MTCSSRPICIRTSPGSINRCETIRAIVPDLPLGTRRLLFNVDWCCSELPVAGYEVGVGSLLFSPKNPSVWMLLRSTDAVLL